MAARVKPEDLKFEIEEFIGTIKESDKHDWCKAVAKISWNDSPATLDIRNMNMSQNRIGKGISLSDEEADRLTDIMLENDFGSLDSLESAIKRKKSRFTVSQGADNCFDEEEKYHIDIRI